MRAGSTTDYRDGRFRRRLPPVPLFEFVPVANGTEIVGVQARRLKLSGVSSLLNIGVAAGIIPIEGQSEVFYPAIPGTLQVTPIFKHPEYQPLILKPLVPVPKTLPAVFGLGAGILVGGGAGLEEPIICDEAYVDVYVDLGEYATTALAGRLTVEVSAEYNGSWWDVRAVEALLGDVVLQKDASARVFTGGGG